MPAARRAPIDALILAVPETAGSALYAMIDVLSAEQWLSRNFWTSNAVARAVQVSKIPERSIKRRFKVTTGSTLIQHVQFLRIEEAKRRLESGEDPIDEIGAEVGYDEPAFFRRLFKRHTGPTPGEYRRLFRPTSQMRTPK